MLPLHATAAVHQTAHWRATVFKSRSYIMQKSLWGGKEVGDYIGVCEPAFKGRWSDHNSSFRQERYRAKTQLSQLVWKLKDEGKVPQVTWSILRKCSPYRAGSRHCDLCLWEKFYIINRDSGCINKKDELLGKCRHMNKFLLMNYKCRRKNTNR